MSRPNVLLISCDPDDLGQEQEPIAVYVENGQVCLAEPGEPPIFSFTQSDWDVVCSFVASGRVFQ
jgi:hypothetical protein